MSAAPPACAPTAITAISTLVTIASLGGGGVNGGIATYNVAATAPPPVALVTTFDHIEAVTVATGAGDDTITLMTVPDPTVVQSLTIDSGDGNDIVVLQALSPTTTVDLGAATTRRRSRWTTANASLNLDGGAGNDTITLNQLGANDQVTITGGADADRILISAPISRPHPA